MVAITQLQLRLVTADRENAGSDGDVFLGVAGREYFVDSAANDFERGSDRTYVFGLDATVVRPTENDPRRPWQTDTRAMSYNPTYIRFEPGVGGDWLVSRVDLTVVDALNGSIQLSRLEGNESLWLGQRCGKYLYLR